MKGYSKIDVNLASKARDNYRAWIKLMEEKIDMLIHDYYLKFYTNGNWFTRQWHKKQTPEQFFSSQLDWFESYDEELWKVTEDDHLLNDIRMWSYGQWNKESRAIRHLISSTHEEYILCDNELCSFVEKWK